MNRPLAVLFVVALSILACGCAEQKEKNPLMIYVMDAPKSMEFGNVTSLVLTFSEVSVHRAQEGEELNQSEENANATESTEEDNSGWILVVNATKTIDLLQFTDVPRLLGENMTEVGRYNQIRLKINSGKMTADGTEYDIDVPSSVLRLNKGFTIESGKALRLILDFQVEKSIVMTGSGEFKLKPVISVRQQAFPK